MKRKSYHIMDKLNTRIEQYLTRTILIFLLFKAGAVYGYELEVKSLKCDFQEDPAGIENKNPGLSWEIYSDQRNINQAVFQVMVASSMENLNADDADIWNPGITQSDQSIQIQYEGKPLKSATRYYWKVRVQDQHGVFSPFSKASFFETGMLEEGDWKADWIYGPNLESDACPWFRKTFNVESLPSRATAFVGSVGYHELYINGRKVSDAILTPSVSDLSKRALYNTYDITPYLKKGKNAVAIWLASGWADFQDFNPPADFGRNKKPLCIVQMHLDRDRLVLSDSTWRYSPSNTWHLGKWENSDFGGDSVNAMIAMKDWNQPEFDDSSWESVGVDDPRLHLTSDHIEPNRMVKQIRASAISPVSDGVYQVAMDKLYTGWIEVNVKGRPGNQVIIRASAHPDKTVEFNQRNVYVIGPDGQGTFRNRFSYHEIGYVNIEGLDYEPDLADIVGYQVTNDRKVIGGFDCSDTLLKQIFDITAYNYENLSTGGMSVDCPHRERLGYGGDGHGSLEIALDAYSSHPFFTKWAQDWVDIQDENGRINHTAPTLGGGGGPAWSGFILTMPWEVYLSYGDRRILESTFPSAVRWLDYIARHVGEDGLLGIPSPGHWEYVQDKRWLFLGDWATPHGSEESNTPEAALFNNCYYVYVLGLAAEMAGILDQPDKALAYQELARQITNAINDKFFDPETHTYIDTRQTHCVMPLIAGVVPAEDIRAVQENLEQEILVNRDGHFDTGIHGTYYLVKYLTAQDRSDLIHTLASQTTFPGYGFFISKGYITWPEYWHECNSIMHGCLNGIGGWFQRGLAGIRADPASPGYRKMVIKPAVSAHLEWVNAYHDSPYGRIACNWKNINGHLEVVIIIPANTSATVCIPATDAARVTESGKLPADARGVTFLGEEKGHAIFLVGSGKYNFKI
jgi:alpha-L-rhamnosidase